MYHIVKTKSKTQPFQVVLIGRNSKVLSSSETFKTSRSCIRNIKAQCSIHGTGIATIQYDYLKIITAVRTNFNNGYEVLVTPKAKYIPGKNPKKRK